MRHQLTLDDEELAELETLVRRELAASRVQHRRTSNPAFRDGVKHEIEVEQRLLRTLERAEAAVT